MLSSGTISPLTVCRTYLDCVQRIYSEWQKICLQRCDDEIRLYWICRQEQGLLTPLRCREENSVMTECLSACSTDEAGFNAHKAKRVAEIEALATGKGVAASASTASGTGKAGSAPRAQ